VRLIGRRPPAEVATVLRSSDVFVLASLSEGISNAVLEGMATGLPVVTTRAGGMAEAVTDGVEGLLVELGDPDELAAALVRLAADPEEAAAMGRRGRRRVEADFDARNQLEAYAQLFEEAARLGPAGSPESGPGDRSDRTAPGGTGVASTTSS
jgi:glycosyltransferase involved in cell wall biosynthesis